MVNIQILKYTFKAYCIHFKPFEASTWTPVSFKRLTIWVVVNTRLTQSWPAFVTKRESHKPYFFNLSKIFRVAGEWCHSQWDNGPDVNNIMENNHSYSAQWVSFRIVQSSAYIVGQWKQIQGNFRNLHKSEYSVSDEECHILLRKLFKFSVSRFPI